MRRSKNIHLHFNGYAQDTKTQRWKKQRLNIALEHKTNKQTMAASREGEEKRAHLRAHTHTLKWETVKKNKGTEPTIGMLKTDSSYCNQNSTCAYKLSRFLGFYCCWCRSLFVIVLFQHSELSEHTIYDFKCARVNAITCLHNAYTLPLGSPFQWV